MHLIASILRFKNGHKTDKSSVFAVCGGGARAHPRWQKFYCGITQKSIPEPLQHRSARGLLRLMSTPSLSSVKHQSGKYDLWHKQHALLMSIYNPTRALCARHVTLQSLVRSHRHPAHDCLTVVGMKSFILAYTHWLVSRIAMLQYHRDFSLQQNIGVVKETPRHAVFETHD